MCRITYLFLLQRLKERMSGDRKKQLKVRHFSPDAVIASAETLLDGNFLNFSFEWLVKVRVAG